MHPLKEGKYLIQFSIHIAKYLAQKRNSLNTCWINWQQIFLKSNIAHNEREKSQNLRGELISALK